MSSGGTASSGSSGAGGTAGRPTTTPTTSSGCSCGVLGSGNTSARTSLIVLALMCLFPRRRGGPSRQARGRDSLDRVRTSLACVIIAFAAIAGGCTNSASAPQSGSGGAKQTGGTSAAGGAGGRDLGAGGAPGSGGKGTGGTEAGHGGATAAGGSVASSGGTPSDAGGVSSGGAMAGGSAGSGTAGARTGGSTGVGGGMPSSGGSGGNTIGTGGSAGSGTAGARTGGSTGFGGGMPSSGGSGGSTIGTGGSAGGGAGGGAQVGDAGFTDASNPDGAPGYKPCPTDGSACKIMPFGDSITEGFPIQAAGGYRARVFHDSLTDKKKISLVGSLSDGPATVDGVTFPKNHEGHFAWNLDQLSGLLPSAVTSQSPHIILVHVGTNNRDGAVADAGTKLSSFLDKLIAAAPNALIVLAQIIPVGDGGNGDAFVKGYNALMPAMVQSRASAGKHIELVDQFSTFDVATMFPPAPNNQLHPNQPGYDHMGDVWWESIRSSIP